MSGIVARSVYLISDLHLGGTYGKTPKGRGFRINTHVDELTQFVETLASSAADGPKIELVINGNMVDFLAEREPSPPYWKPFTTDPESACAKLQAIADRDPTFFTGLGCFLEKGHRLTILTGNHDIELALPSVRRRLKEIIGVKSIYDYELICFGEAYQVGEALIEHGNRYDQWNAVNYDGLRRISSLLSRRQTIPKQYDFEPPAGNKLVSWVINEIKEDYKFIDLLKPETDVAFPLLLALEPGYRKLLATVAMLGLQAYAHREGTHSVRSLDSPYQAIDEESALEQVLRNRLGNDSRAFLDALSPPSPPVTRGLLDSDISTLKIFDRPYGLAQLLLARDDQDIGSRLPALLKALQALQRDRTFDVTEETATEYTGAANELFERKFEYVIFGHTHLAKKIELKPGRWYLNSGTWSDLMRLPDNIVGANAADARKVLDPFVQDIGGGYLDRWIIFRPTYIKLDLDTNDHITRAELLPYEGSTAVKS